MTQPPTILDSRSSTPEEEQLAELFTEIASKQIVFLDQAAQRIIELVTALLGIGIAVIAFGHEFPPPYLAGSLWAKGLGITALMAHLGALCVALWAIHPRDYQYYPYNLTEMRAVLAQLIANKVRPLRVAGLLFAVGSLALATLIGLIIATAA